ncbi:hypothetical protein BGZ98_004817 [Dissophora globulifera]|nr:hypothetical protein BGZ98_004817 [Dissophora globulifera]
MMMHVLQQPPVQQSLQDVGGADDRTSKALARISEFSRAFEFNGENQSLEYWQQFVSRFYGASGRFRYRLFQQIKGENKTVDVQTGESKSFELITASLPRFYLGNVEAGVKAMQLSIEPTLGPTTTSNVPLTIECPSVTLMSHYTNGSRVFTRGSIKVTFANDLKFDLLELTSLDFTEDGTLSTISDGASTATTADVKLEGKKKKGSSKRAAVPPKKLPPTIPETVVNEYGIAPKTMRLLEIADVSSKMNELIMFSAHTKMGAIESLAVCAQQLRERQTVLRSRQLSIQSNSPILVNAFATPMLVPQTLQQTSSANTPSTAGGAAGAGGGVAAAGAVTAAKKVLVRASASPRSVKRRPSAAISPSDSGQVSSPREFSAVEDMQGHSTNNAGTPTISHAVMNSAGYIHNNSSTSGAAGPGMMTGLKLELVGSPLQQPIAPASSMTSPVFTPSTLTGAPSTSATPMARKGSKRIRTASMTPNMTTATTTGAGGSEAAGSKGSNAPGGQGRGRSRKQRTLRQHLQRHHLPLPSRRQRRQPWQPLQHRSLDKQREGQVSYQAAVGCMHRVHSWLQERLALVERG